MADGVLAAAEALRQALAGFDPELLSGVDCAVVAEALAATEKISRGCRGPGGGEGDRDGGL